MAVSIEDRPTPAKAMAVSIEARPTPAKAMAVSIGARPAPAKATMVSTPHRCQQAKATPVSGERAAWSTGPRCDTRGRRRGLAGQRADAPSHTSVHPAPLVWRAPEGPAAVPVGAGGTCRGAGGRRRDLPRCRWAAAGPGQALSRRTQPHVSTPSAAGVEGAGGSGGHGRASRSTLPSRRLACGDLAGGRARRRPEHQRSHKQQHTARTARGRAAAHRHTQRPGPPTPGTPVGPQRNEAATGCPATASSRSRSAVHNSATSNQAVMST